MTRHTPAARLRGPGNEPVGGGSSVNPFETFESSTGVGVSVADGVTLNNPVANLRGPGNDPVDAEAAADPTGALTQSDRGLVEAQNDITEREQDPTLVETASGGKATVEAARRLGLGPFASEMTGSTDATGQTTVDTTTAGTTSTMPASSGGASLPGGGLLVALLVGLAVLFSGVLS
jgi:hypothetical protein